MQSIKKALNLMPPVPPDILFDPDYEYERRARAQLAGTRSEGFAEIIPDENHRSARQKPADLSPSEECDFCKALQKREQGIVLATEHFFLKLDNFPVNEGHALIIPKRHVSDFFGLNIDEWEDLPCIVRRAKGYLDEVFHPDGYNIGINCGEAAGQTIFHCHIHLIPRYNGDVENPRGGIRNFKKPLVEYH